VQQRPGFLMDPNNLSPSIQNRFIEGPGRPT